MATSPPTILPNPKDTKYFDYMSKFKKEASYFLSELTASGKPWPRAVSPEELSYNNWLAEVVDPTTGDYYFTEENGIRNTIKYEVDMIIRFRKTDGSEWLLSQGTLRCPDYFKDEKRFRCNKPEMHIKTKFSHDRSMDSKRRIVRVCKGPIGSEEIYEMPFTVENAEKLWSLKRDGNIQLIVKDQLSSEPHAIERKGILRPNDYQGAFEMFKNQSFDYLYNFEYTKYPTKPVDEPATTNILLTGTETKKLQPEIVTANDLNEISRAHPDTKVKINKSDNPDKVK